MTDPFDGGVYPLDYLYIKVKANKLPFMLPLCEVLDATINNITDDKIVLATLGRDTNTSKELTSELIEFDYTRLLEVFRQSFKYKHNEIERFVLQKQGELISPRVSEFLEKYN